jgi:hypothetical protein
MNATLTMTPTLALTRTMSQVAETAAVKKVVLLLGRSPDVRQNIEQGARKKRIDVRPPPRWGLND